MSLRDMCPHLQWILPLGHAGMEGNEIAHRLSVEACAKAGCGHDRFRGGDRSEGFGVQDEQMVVVGGVWGVGLQYGGR